MLISIWILLIVLGLVNRKSFLLTLIQIVFSIFMFTFNDGNPDRLMYINDFWILKSDPSQILHGNSLFNLFLYIFGIFNQYNIAVFFIALISFCFLYKGIKFYTNSTSLVISLYLISPFIIDSTQLKNFMAMCIWIYFSKYLYLSVQKQFVGKNTFLYLIGVVLATLVHFSFMYTAIYIFLITIRFDSIKSIFFNVFSLIIIIFGVNKFPNILSSLNNTGISSFQLASSKLGDYTLNFNVGDTNARLKVTILFFILIFGAFFVLNKNANETVFSKRYYLFIVKLTIICFPILFIISSASMEMYRIQRDLLPMYYILFAILLDNEYVIEKKETVLLQNIKIYVFAVGVALFYFLVESFIWNYISVFKPMFHF